MVMMLGMIALVVLLSLVDTILGRNINYEKHDGDIYDDNN